MCKVTEFEVVYYTVVDNWSTGTVISGTQEHIYVYVSLNTGTGDGIIRVLSLSKKFRGQLVDSEPW